MEALQAKLTIEVDRQLSQEKPNIQYLDVLNRLLGTVNQWLIMQENFKRGQ